MTTASIPVGDEILVTTITTESSINAKVTGLTGGGYVVVWEWWDSTFTDNLIDMSYVRADGTIIGMSIIKDGDVYNPAITALEDGGFVVTWSETAYRETPTDIYAQRYDANGSTVGASFQVNTNGIGVVDMSDVTSLEDGGFVVTWQSSGQDGDGYGVYAQRYDVNSAAVGSEFLVNTTTTNNQYAVSITSLSNGGFVVTWQSDGQDGSGFGVYGQIYDVNSALVGVEFLINDETADHQLFPSITSLVDGGFVVTWASNNQDGDSYGVYGQRYDAGGAVVGAEFQINTETSSGQGAPSIAALHGGGFIVIWNSYSQDGSGQGIFGQRFDYSGAVVGDEFQINTYVLGTQSDPEVAALADGSYVVTWQSYGQAGSEFTIHSQKFAAQIYGSIGNDTLTDIAGTNWMNGRSGDDVLDGGDGDDFFEEVAYDTDGSDVYIGGNGIDTMRAGDVATTLTGWIFDLKNGIQTFGGITYDTYSGIENLEVYGAGTLIGESGANILTGHLGASGGGFVISGKGGNDTLNGSAGADTINGGSGDDTLNGGAEADTINGGSGNDTLNGGDGNDWLNGRSGDDMVFGGAGDDVVVHSRDTTGSNSYDGGDDIDTLRFTFDWGTAGVRIDMVAGEVRDGNNIVFATFTNFENVEVFGSVHILGDSSANRIVGGDGADMLNGGGGDDTLNGGAGADNLHGEYGNDTLNGGQGGDYLTGGAGSDTLNGGNGDDHFSEQFENIFITDIYDGGAGIDSLLAGWSGINLEGWTFDLLNGIQSYDGAIYDTYFSIENLEVYGGATLIGDNGANILTSHRGGSVGGAKMYGNDGDDVLTGGSGRDRLYGNSGNDALLGGTAKDHLFGGRGDDTISGGDGQDTLQGGKGKDTLTGGADADVFVFTQVSDSLNSKKADVITDFEIGVDHIDLSDISSLIFIGGTGFSGISGELRVGNNGTDSFVRVDVDGDGSADMKIILEGVTGLTVEDFIL